MSACDLCQGTGMTTTSAIAGRPGDCGKFVPCPSCTAKQLARDRMLYGNSFQDADGKRVDPRSVQLGEDGTFKIKPVRLTRGRYRSPDGVLGRLTGFDPLACCYTFEPDGFVPPAIIGPGKPDGRIRFGEAETAGWELLTCLMWQASWTACGRGCFPPPLPSWATYDRDKVTCPACRKQLGESEAARDRLLYGGSFQDADGRRVDPRTVFLAEDGTYKIVEPEQPSVTLDLPVGEFWEIGDSNVEPLEPPMLHIELPEGVDLDTIIVEARPLGYGVMLTPGPNYDYEWIDGLLKLKVPSGGAIAVTVFLDPGMEKAKLEVPVAVDELIASFKEAEASSPPSLLEIIDHPGPRVVRPGEVVMPERAIELARLLANHSEANPNGPPDYARVLREKAVELLSLLPAKSVPAPSDEDWNKAPAGWAELTDAEKLASAPSRCFRHGYTLCPVCMGPR